MTEELRDDVATDSLLLEPSAYARPEIVESNPGNKCSLESIDPCAIRKLAIEKNSLLI